MSSEPKDANPACEAASSFAKAAQADEKIRLYVISEKPIEHLGMIQCLFMLCATVISSRTDDKGILMLEIDILKKLAKNLEETAQNTQSFKISPEPFKADVVLSSLNLDEYQKILELKARAVRAKVLDEMHIPPGLIIPKGPCFC